MNKLTLIIAIVFSSLFMQAQSNSINRYDGMTSKEVEPSYEKYVINNLRATTLIKVNKYIMISAAGLFGIGYGLYKLAPDGPKVSAISMDEDGNTEYHHRYSVGQSIGYGMMVGSILSFTYTIPFTVGAHFTRKKARKNIELIKNRR